MKRKVLTVFLALVMLASFICVNISAATVPHESGIVSLPSTEPQEDNVGISAYPAQLSGAGKVTIRISITNTNSALQGEFFQELSGIKTSKPTELPTETPIVQPTDPTPTPSETPVPEHGSYTDVNIANEYGVVFPSMNVPMGETVVFSGEMNVSEEQIGATLIFVVSWFDTLTGSSHSRELRIVISRANTAYLKLSRTMSKSDAEAGETVTLTYTLVNTGTMALNNITVIDKEIAGSNPIVTPFSLAPGRSYQFTYNYTMGNESVISHPTATFRAEGSYTLLSVSASKQTLGFINTQLIKEVNIGSSTPEGVVFTLYLTNNGSQRISDLRVTDELGNQIANGFSLAIGETKIIEYFVANPLTVRNVVFRITGTDSSGNTFTDNTKSYPVRPYIDPSTLGIDFEVQVVAPLNAENIISLMFTVRNTGSVDYTDVILTEEQISYELQRIDILRPSSTGYVFTIDVNTGMERELVFKLNALDSSGNAHEYIIRMNASYHGEIAGTENDPPAPASPTIVQDANLGSKLDGLLTSVGETLTIAYSVIGIAAIVVAFIVVGLAVYEFVIRRKLKQKTD